VTFPEEFQALELRANKLQEAVRALPASANERQQAIVARGEELEQAVQGAVSDAQTSINALLNELVALDKARTDATSQIAEAASRVSEVHQAAHDSLDSLDSTIDSGLPRLQQLLQRSQSWFSGLEARTDSEAGELLEQVQGEFARSVEALGVRATESVAQHREEIASLLQEFENTAGRLGEALRLDAESVCATITENWQSLSSCIQTDVTSTVSGLSSAFDRVSTDVSSLNQKIVDIRTALGELTGTVTDTAETTTVAMESTNVGLNTAADLFDNLRGTIKDIQELWES
jgi:DNA repair exonuclease SbcCD ATPase subunit